MRVIADIGSNALNIMSVDPSGSSNQLTGLLSMMPLSQQLVPLWGYYCSNLFVRWFSDLIANYVRNSIFITRNKDELFFTLADTLCLNHHPFILVPACSGFTGVCWRASPSCHGVEAGPQTTFTHIFTSTDNLQSPVDLERTIHDWKEAREPTQTQGEHATTTQKGPGI